jgi:hypothetical protein
MKKIIFFLLALVLFTPSTSFAKDSAGVVTYTRGEAWLFRGMESLKISMNSPVYPGDTVSTTITGRVKVSMADGSVMFVGGRSRIKVDNYLVKDGELLRGDFNVIWGRASFRVSKLNAHRSRFAVRSQMVTLNTFDATFAVEGWDAGFSGSSSKEDVSLWNSWDMIPAAWAVAIFPASSKGGGMSIGFPDVCKTPAPPQPVVPVAYPNIALTSGSASLKVKKVEVGSKEVVKKGGGKSAGVVTHSIMSGQVVTHSIKSGQVATFSPSGNISFRPITVADKKLFHIALLKADHPNVIQQKQGRMPVNPAQSTTTKPGPKGEPLTQSKGLTPTKPGSTPLRQPEGITPLPAKSIPAPLPGPIIQPRLLPKPIVQPRALPKPITPRP